MSVTMQPPAPLTAHQGDPYWIRPARMIGRKSEVEGVLTFEVKIVEAEVRDAYSFRGGQFNMLYVHGVGECPMSISSSEDSPRLLSHTIRMVGQVTDALAREPDGAAIGIRGPFGSCWPLAQAKGRNLILVAGGIGLPPLRPVIYSVMKNRALFRRVILVYGSKTVSDLLFTEEYDAWEKHEIELMMTVDRADASWKGERGLPPHAMKKLHLRGAGNVVLTCGPEIMMKYVIQQALDNDIPEDHIHVSMERNMICACTFCGHCQLGPEFVCKDGPVFPYARIKRYFGREGF